MKPQWTTHQHRSWWTLLFFTNLGCSPIAANGDLDGPAPSEVESTGNTEPTGPDALDNPAGDSARPSSDEPPPAFSGPGPVTGTWSSASGGARDLTQGATVFTDHVQDENPSSPSVKENLIDGNPDSMFAMYRVADYDFRLDLAEPALVQSVELTPPWEAWSQPRQVLITSASGESTLVMMSGSGRTPVRAQLPFQYPTDFLEFHILEATNGNLGNGLDEYFGGLAELRVDGVPVTAGSANIAESARSALIDDVRVDLQGDGTTRVQWSTALPATSQLSFRDTTGVYWSHGDQELRNQHEVVINSTSVAGFLRLRSVTGEGRTEEHWDESLADGGKLNGRDFLFGVGADHSSAMTFEGQPTQGSSAWVKRDGLRNDFVNTWLSRDNDWQSWLPSWLQEAQQEGYQAQVLHWFYGDNPLKSDVLSTRDAYRASIITMDRMLQESGLGSSAVVTLEPEYNSPGGDLAAWEGWNDIMIDAIDIIKAGSGAQVCLYAGWWDNQNFVTTSLGRAALHADCVSTMKMAASEDTTVAPGAREAKARNAVSDAIRFSHFMRRKFMIPVRWDYFMVSNYGGWESIQTEVVGDLCNRIPEIKANGVMGIAWMAYQDGGVQHNFIYGNAEYHKGLVDISGNNKSGAWDLWNTCGGL